MSTINWNIDELHDIVEYINRAQTVWDKILFMEGGEPGPANLHMLYQYVKTTNERLDDLEVKLFKLYSEYD